jgi:hypothetical protein
MAAGEAAARLKPWSVAAGALALGSVLAALAVVIAPGLRIGLPADPALPLRGWPDLASRIDSAARTHGAAWVGAASYGVTAQLAAQTTLNLPVMQISERERWPVPPDGRIADPRRPGLLVDLPRRIDLRTLHTCFAHVESIGVLRRGAPGEPSQLYEVLSVASPRVDLWREGCPGADPSGR